MGLDDESLATLHSNSYAVTDAIANLAETSERARVGDEGCTGEGENQNGKTLPTWQRYILLPLPLSPMTSNAYWSEVCELAVGRPLETLLSAVYTSSGVTVRKARAAAAAAAAILLPPPAMCITLLSRLHSTA